MTIESLQKKRPAIAGQALLVAAVILMSLAGAAPAASAQDITVGGHVGFVIPWVTRSGGQTVSEFDNPQSGFPIGVTFNGKGHMAVDLEMIPFFQGSPRAVTLVVDPGVLYHLSNGYTVGVRAAFSINSSQVGFIPLLNKAWKIKNPGFFKVYFAEADLPVQFNRPTGGLATNAVTFATHFGLGF